MYICIYKLTYVYIYIINICITGVYWYDGKVLYLSTVYLSVDQYKNLAIATKKIKIKLYFKS